VLRVQRADPPRTDQADLDACYLAPFPGD
jgi:hypothetical protein